MLATLIGLGHEAEGFNNISDALTEHNLNWGVELRPTFYRKADGQLGQIKDGFAVVRTDTDAVLGRVGSDYTPLENSKALAHADRLIEIGAASLDAVFELKGGRKVGASLRLNEDLTVAGEDPHALYITMITSHDGSTATMTNVTPIRLWCTNQLSLSFRNARHAWSVRHLSKIEDQLALVRSELEYVTTYKEEFEKTGETLVLTKMSEREMRMIAEAALSFVASEDSKKKSVDSIIETWNTSALIGDDYRNTAWGALNAVTEWVDHKRNYRSAEAKYTVITSGFGARVRNNALSALLEVAGAAA